MLPANTAPSSTSFRCSGAMIKRYDIKVRDQNLRPEVMFESRRGHVILEVVKTFSATSWRGRERQLFCCIRSS